MWRIRFEKVNPHQKLINSIKVAFENGGWEAAKEVCRNTKGDAAFLAYEIIEICKKE